MEGYHYRAGESTAESSGSPVTPSRRVLVRSLVSDGDPSPASGPEASVMLPQTESVEGSPFSAEVKTLSFNVTEFFSAIEQLPRHEHEEAFREADMLVQSYFAVLDKYEAQVAGGASAVALETLVTTLRSLESKLEQLVTASGLEVATDGGVVASVSEVADTSTVVERIQTAVGELVSRVATLQTTLPPEAPEQVYLTKVSHDVLPELQRLSADGTTLSTMYSRFTVARDRLEDNLRYLELRTTVHEMLAGTIPDLKVRSGALRQLGEAVASVAPAAESVLLEVRDIEADIAWLREPVSTIDWTTGSFQAVEGPRQDLERLQADVASLTERLATSTDTLEHFITPEVLAAVRTDLERRIETMTLTPQERQTVTALWENVLRIEAEPTETDTARVMSALTAVRVALVETPSLTTVQERVELLLAEVATQVAAKKLDDTTIQGFVENFKRLAATASESDAESMATLRQAYDNLANYVTQVIAPADYRLATPENQLAARQIEWRESKVAYEAAEEAYRTALTAHYATWQGKGAVLAGKFGFTPRLPSELLAMQANVQALAVTYESTARTMREARVAADAPEAAVLARYQRLFARQLMTRRIGVTVEAQRRLFAESSVVAEAGKRVASTLAQHKQLVRYGGAAVLGMVTGGTAAALFGVGRAAVGGALMGALTNAGVLDAVSETVGGTKKAEVAEAALNTLLSSVEATLVAAGAAPVTVERLAALEAEVVAAMRTMDAAKRARAMRILGVLLVAGTVSGMAAAELLQAAGGAADMFGQRVLVTPSVQPDLPPVVDAVPPAPLQALPEEYYGVRLVDPDDALATTRPFSTLATEVPADPGIELPETPEPAADLLPTREVPTTVLTVAPGDTFSALWKSLQTEVGGGLSPAEREAVFSEWYTKIASNADWQHKIGITSGSIHSIFVGDTLDFTPVLTEMGVLSVVPEAPVAASVPLEASVVVRAGDTLTALVTEAAAPQLAAVPVEQQEAVVAAAVAALQHDPAAVSAVGIQSGDVDELLVGEQYQLAPAIDKVTEAVQAYSEAKFHDWQQQITESPEVATNRVGLALQYPKEGEAIIEAHEAEVQAVLEKAMRPLMKSDIEQSFTPEAKAAVLAEVNKVLGVGVVSDIVLTEVVASAPSGEVALPAETAEKVSLMTAFDRSEAELQLGGAEAFAEAYQSWLQELQLATPEAGMFERLFTTTPQYDNIIEVFGDEPVDRLQAIANLEPAARATELSTLRLDPEQFDTVQRLLIDMRNEGLMTVSDMEVMTLTAALERYFSSVMLPHNNA